MLSSPRFFLAHPTSRKHVRRILGNCPIGQALRRPDFTFIFDLSPLRAVKKTLRPLPPLFYKARGVFALRAGNSWPVAFLTNPFASAIDQDSVFSPTALRNPLLNRTFGSLRCAHGVSGLDGQPCSFPLRFSLPFDFVIGLFSSRDLF